VGVELLHAEKNGQQTERHDVNKPLKVKGKDYNSQTQRYLYSILIIYYSIMGYMFRLTSSHLQALKIQIQTYKRLLRCGIPNA